MNARDEQARPMGRRCEGEEGLVGEDDGERGAGGGREGISMTRVRERAEM